MDITRLIGMGVIPQEKIEQLLTKTASLLETNLNASDSRAVKRLWDVLLKAAQVDQAERHKFIDKEQPDLLHVRHATEEMKELINQARNDESYVGLERQRAAETYTNSSLNGTNGHAGPMANGSAPSTN